MSCDTVSKLLRCLGLSAFIALAMPGWTWAQATCASCGTGGCAPTAECGTCATCASCQSCQWFHCPPAFHHCQEGPPCLWFKCGCPHPVCNPCTLQHYGYFEACWTPYPFPADWSHCPTPPPAAFVTLNPLATRTPVTPGGPTGDPRGYPTAPNMLPPVNGLPGGPGDLPAPRRSGF